MPSHPASIVLTDLAVKFWNGPNASNCLITNGNNWRISSALETVNLTIHNNRARISYQSGGKGGWLLIWLNWASHACGTGTHSNAQFAANLGCFYSVQRSVWSDFSGSYLTSWHWADAPFLFQRFGWALGFSCSWLIRCLSSPAAAFTYWQC